MFLACYGVVGEDYGFLLNERSSIFHILAFREIRSAFEPYVLTYSFPV